MSPLVLTLPWSADAGADLVTQLDAEAAELSVRRFPDGESHVQLLSDPAGRDVVVVASLDHPDAKVIPLLLVLETARELGARTVGLVAPYLCYLRQDRRFRPGEAVSARVFPRILGRPLDWLVTVDPHLHRIQRLEEVYPIPSRVVHAAPAIAGWVREHVALPLLIGPDSESEQWVGDVASRADAPFVVLEKVRRGDRDVQVSVPQVDRWRDRTPVLVDDIISTGRTMIETLGHLGRAGLAPGICIGVHGLFDDHAQEALVAAGAARILTCDAVPHPSNGIALAPLLAPAVASLLAQVVP